MVAPVAATPAAKRERILVVGAGIAGLCTALRLGGETREVTLLERDDAPPEGGPDVAFDQWQRRGVGQLRQSHAFLARLRNIIRDEHPQLLADLYAAGCRDIAFADMLPPALRDRYVPQPGDADLTILTSRRTTLELVIRRYVERLPGVTIRSGVKVRELVSHKDARGTIVVTGVVADTAAGREEIAADDVVDAGGKAANLIEQLIKAGAPIGETAETAGVLYFTRHYRLRDGQEEPPRGEIAASGDLGYLKFGVFPADNQRFSITLCVPEIEYGLRLAVMDGEMFQRICLAMPGMAPWVDPVTSEPVGRVIGMGDLHSRWRTLVSDGKPAVLGYFAIGDALVRTNPLYGRGCSLAAVSAGVLRRALDTTADPAKRLLIYDGGLRAEVKPYYDLMLKQDRSAIRRARATLTPGHRPRIKARLAKSFIEDGITVAARSDVDLMRAMMRGFHMLEHPEAWLKRPANLGRVLGYWARGAKRNAAAYAPKPGPDRPELMARLGLDAQADMLAA
ncbi:NAD(P)/FAD-dependent oxidoreductase [Sphingomonas sp. TZW2008]|uniref:NAD(P)/FAD-dependent oxidoreductase n=1 Tax=Sphingomonas sp. TZW2008 TaxID=1917973 RepID=UPI000A268DE9|nr:FAD-binding protein [Sphingomonas sp. TZW2008]